MQIQTDLVEGTGPVTLVNAVVEQFGRLDVLVNNAGEMTDLAVGDMPDKLWERTLAQNLTTAVRCARASLEVMIPNRWGRIINITSQATFSESANNAHYAASKSGLAGFNTSLAKEVGPYGVTVNMIAHMELVRQVLPSMIERHAGTITFTGSLSTELSMIHLGCYVPSKIGQVAAMRAYARDRRADAERRGIVIDAVCPGLVDTDASRPWFPDMSRAQTPAAAAAALIALALDAQPPYGELVQHGKVIGEGRVWFRGKLWEV